MPQTSSDLSKTIAQDGKNFRVIEFSHNGHTFVVTPDNTVLLLDKNIKTRSGGAKEVFRAIDKENQQYAWVVEKAVEIDTSSTDVFADYQRQKLYAKKDIHTCNDYR